MVKFIQNSGLKLMLPQLRYITAQKLDDNLDMSVRDGGSRVKTFEGLL